MVLSHKYPTDVERPTDPALPAMEPVTTPPAMERVTAPPVTESAMAPPAAPPVTAPATAPPVHELQAPKPIDTAGNAKTKVVGYFSQQ